jgi:superkiller protein 3
MNVMNKRIAFGLATCLVLAALPALAQSGAAECRGKIVDEEGNPIPGVNVVFTNPARPDVRYEGKTNKKGRYYITGLLYDEASKIWNMAVEFEGMVPTKLTLRSRTPTIVLENLESKIEAGQTLPKFMIGGFGEVYADLVMGPETEATTAAAASGAAPTEAAVITEAAPQQTRDPWQQAVQKANAGELEASVPFFEEAVEAEPEDAERRRAFAQVLYQLEDYGKAARQAIQATTLAPESLDGHMVLYSIYVGSNNLAGAAAALDQARGIAPDDMRVLQQTAFLAEQSGDAEQSMQAYEAIVEVDPQNAEAWTTLGGLYAEANRVTDSEAAYQKVVEIAPDEAYQVFYNLGVLIMNRSNVTEADNRKAVEAFRKATEINPEYAPAYQQLAFALLGTGDMQGTREALQRYVELRPDAADAADMKAMIDSLK